MKIRHKIGVGLAFAAIVHYWIEVKQRKSMAQQRAKEAAFLREAVDTFEDEGGLVSR